MSELTNAFSQLDNPHKAGVILALAVAVGAIAMAIKYRKEIGLVPMLLVPLALYGVWYGWSIRKVEPAAPNVEQAKPLSQPATQGYFTSFFRSVSEPATRVKLTDGKPDEPGSSYGLCGYCKSTLVISGDKSGSIVCPNCGARMPATKCILYLQHCNERGYY